jgi:hypothetical protein
MRGRRQRGNLANQFRHFVHRVDTGARIGRVCRLAEGLQYDLRAAPLSALKIQFGGFADDDTVRMNAFRDLPGSDAFETFLVDHAGDVNVTCEIPLCVLGEERGGCHHGADCAFHIGGAATIDLAVSNLGGEGIVRPAGLIGHGHGVDVTVEKEDFAWTIALNAAQNIAVGIDPNFVEFPVAEGLSHAFDDGHLLPGITLCPDERLAQGNDLAASFLCQHCFLAPSAAAPSRLYGVSLSGRLLRSFPSRRK